MACTATFPKEIPYDCALQLVKDVKAKAPVGQLMQEAAQVLGQAGALMGGSTVGAGPSAEDDGSLTALADQLDAELGKVQAGGETGGVFSQLALQLLLQIIMKVLS